VPLIVLAGFSCSVFVSAQETSMNVIIMIAILFFTFFDLYGKSI
jgi:hypothetical protein